MSFDLVIRSRAAVLPHGQQPAAVAVQDGKVAAIAEYSAIRVNCLVLTNDSISRAALVAALMAAASQGLAQNPVTYVVVDAHADQCWSGSRQ